MSNDAQPRYARSPCFHSSGMSVTSIGFSDIENAGGWRAAEVIVVVVMGLVAAVFSVRVLVVPSVEASYAVMPQVLVRYVSAAMFL